MSRMAEVGFAIRLVSIFDHFMPRALGKSSALSMAALKADTSLADSGCPSAMPMPRNFSSTMSPAARRPMAEVTVP